MPDKNVFDLWIFGAIGDFWEPGFSSKTLVEELKKVPDGTQTIQVHLSSPGGDAFEGVAIANILRQRSERVEVSIEGMALSAASLVAMAGNTISMAANSLMMIHKPVALMIGNEDAMRETAATLAKFQDSMVTTYRWHSKLNSSQLNSMINATTWMSAEEALQNGLATHVVNAEPVNARIDARFLNLLGPIPAKFKENIERLTCTTASFDLRNIYARRAKK